MITINTITSCISLQLNAAFGDGYEIFTESIEQELTPPCFSIVVMNPSVEQKLGRRYMRYFPYCIYYFPQDENNPIADCNRIAEQLYDKMELLSVNGDLVRGKNMHSEITDNVLAFFIEYDIPVISFEKQTFMQEQHTDVYVAESETDKMRQLDIIRKPK